jgi:nitric oxide reductase NorQ protein
MKDKIYFVEFYTKGKDEIKVRPLPNQLDVDGNPVDTSLNCQFSKDIRYKGKPGDVYCVLNLKKDGRKFYNTTISSDELINKSFYIRDIFGDMPSVSSEVIRKSVFFNELASNGFFACDYFERLGVFDESLKDEPSEPIVRKNKEDNYIDELLKLYPVPTLKECNFYIDKNDWKVLVRNVFRGKNTLIVGPTGTGKTEIIKYLANAVGYSNEYFDMGTMHDAIPSLLGTHRLKSLGEGRTESYFDYSRFSKSIQRPKTIITLDELSRAPLSTNNILFPLLDSRRTLPIDIACSDSDVLIKANDTVVFFATANLGHEYVGVMDLDRALYDRFFVLQLDYMPSKYEIAVLMSRTGIDAGDAEKIVNMANNTRKQHKSETLSTAISTRHTIMISELVKDGFILKDAISMVVYPLYPTDEHSNIKAIISAL